MGSGRWTVDGVGSGWWKVESGWWAVDSGLVDGVQWMVDSGRWTVDDGQWKLDSVLVDGGLWAVDSRWWALDGAQWPVDGGTGWWIMDGGHWMVHSGQWVVDSGWWQWVVDNGQWNMKDFVTIHTKLPKIFTLPQEFAYTSYYISKYSSSSMRWGPSMGVRGVGKGLDPTWGITNFINHSWNSSFKHVRYVTNDSFG